MNEKLKDDKPTIAMLLDVEHLHGDHEGRLGPLVTTLLISGAPVLFYAYYGLFDVIPVWIFAPLEIIFALRIVMLIPGRERYRVESYKRRLYDDYSDVAKLMRIKTIYDDGLVEYVNGRVFYAVKCYNGTCEDELQRTLLLRKLLNSMVGEFEFDVYILNESDTSALRRYYKLISRFGKNRASLMFIKIVDLLISLTKHKSMVMCTVFVIKGTRSDWKQMKVQIDGAILSTMSKAFKKIYRVKDRAELKALISQDIDTNIDIDELLRAKYKTGEYYTSKVVAYDPKDTVIIGRNEDTQKKKKTSNASFHVTYTEDNPVAEEKRAVPKPEYYEPVIVQKTPKDDTEPEERVIPTKTSKSKKGVVKYDKRRKKRQSKEKNG